MATASVNKRRVQNRGLKLQPLAVLHLKCQVECEVLHEGFPGEFGGVMFQQDYRGMRSSVKWYAMVSCLFGFILFFSCVFAIRQAFTILFHVLLSRSYFLLMPPFPAEQQLFTIKIVCIALPRYANVQSRSTWDCASKNTKNTFNKLNSVPSVCSHAARFTLLARYTVQVCLPVRWKQKIVQKRNASKHLIPLFFGKAWHKSSAKKEKNAKRR